MTLLGPDHADRLSRWLRRLHAGVLLCTLLAANAAFADVTIWLFPFAGQTYIRITGGGTNGAPGVVMGHRFSNLAGGDPFDASLDNFTFSAGAIELVEDPELNLASIRFESEPGVNQDNLFFSFNRSFSFGESYDIVTNSSFPVPNAISIGGLDPALLTPGTYTRTDSRFGETTLLITTDPPPDVMPPVSVPMSSTLGRTAALMALLAMATRFAARRRAEA